MNRHRDNNRVVRENAWNAILNQIEAFQARIAELGMTSVIAHCSFEEDRFEVLCQDEDYIGTRYGFEDKKPNHLRNHGFGPGPDRIGLSRDYHGVAKIDIHPQDHDMKLDKAAEIIFGNIINYVRALNGTHANMIKFRVVLENDGGIDVRGIDENGRGQNWQIPDVTNTFRQLTGWVQREAGRFESNLTNRFAGVLESCVREINEVYPGLNLTVFMPERKFGYGFPKEPVEFEIACNGERGKFRITHEGTRTNSKSFGKNGLERAYPGLFGKLAEITRACESIDQTIEIDRSEGIRINLCPGQDHANPGIDVTDDEALEMT